MRERAGDFSYYSAGELLDFFSESPTPAVSVELSPLWNREEDVYRTALLSSVASHAGGRSRVLTETAAPDVSTEREVVVVPTETIFVEGARSADLRWAREAFGAEVVDEGLEGKLLLRAPGDASDRLRSAFAIARSLYQRESVRAAHPNFIRTYQKLEAPPKSTGSQWNHDNPGNPGIFGADVHARAAWTITRGKPEVSVAILDEGVDTLHPDLKPAVRAERDFVDDNPHARPDGDDAHGTACAGIVASQSNRWPGLAPEVGLIAVRIAKDDGFRRWVFDDFQTADAIDWAWLNDASVLSNSWCGGPPVDSIRLAFQRARKRGRGGKGAVIVVSAGNSQSPVGFPGTLPGVLTVGASNQWDEPKTRTSKDGETWWGTNFGGAVRLLAPGVQIPTTDIHGTHGYGKENYTLSFNGTSAAAPHVAAAAALLLSVAPSLNEGQIRKVLVNSTDRLPVQRGLSHPYRRGRLNVYAALRAACRI